MRFVIDLNSKPVKPMLPQLLRKELTDECWQIDLLTTDGLSSFIRVSPMRRTVPGQLQTQKLLLLGPIPLHGLRAVNVSRKPARYRSLSARESDQALSSGHSRSGLAQHAGPRQLGARLAHLRRLCATADQDGARALCQRRLRPGFAANCLRARCDHHRSLPVVVSLGLLSQTQRSRQAAYPARSARQHSYSNNHYSRPNSRCSSARPANLRGWRFLCNGSRLPRLSALASTTSGVRFLCHARPQEIRLSPPLLVASGPQHRRHLRSDYYADQLLSAPRLSRQTAPHSLLRFRKEQTHRLSNQQLYFATADHCPTLSQSLAGRVVLQMDQTTFAHQEILRHLGERAQDSDLDRHLGLRPGGHCQKMSPPRGQSLQNVTDPERHALRKNSDFRSSFIIRLRNAANYCLQTIDPVPLTLGQ